MNNVVLYARVSSEDQAVHGYSIGGQLDELRDSAREWGWEIVAEEIDSGYSRETLYRPGLDNVRELARAGEVDVVLAWKRDRYGASPVPQLLAAELEDYGVKLRALDDSGEGDDADFIHGIKDLIAKRELRDIARRSLMGRRAKANGGAVVGSGKPPYGFRLNETKDGYELVEEEMRVVRRIFREVGLEGRTLYGVRKGLDASGVLTPTGKKQWGQPYLRLVIGNDVYRAHTHDEVVRLLSPTAVASLGASLDPDLLYGIQWWNQHHQIRRQAHGEGGGKPYGYTYKVLTRPREEWIASPVPDSGIPREWVDAARLAIKNNRRPSSAAHRFWELSGGVGRCDSCGCALQTTAIRSSSGVLHFYYRCPRRVRDGKSGCENPKNHRAEELEVRVWEFISGLLKDPRRLREGIDEMIAEKKRAFRRDPKGEARRWLGELAKVETKRARYQEMSAEGLITMDELRPKLQGLEDTRATAQRELDALDNHHHEVDRLERDATALTEHYATLMPEKLDSLTPEQRHHVYRMLRLKVWSYPDGHIEADWAFQTGTDISTNNITNTRNALSTSARSTRTLRASPRL